MRERACATLGTGVGNRAVSRPARFVSHFLGPVFHLLHLSSIILFSCPPRHDKLHLRSSRTSPGKAPREADPRGALLFSPHRACALMDTSPIDRIRSLVTGYSEALLADLLKGGAAPRADAAGRSADGWTVFVIA